MLVYLHVYKGKKSVPKTDKRSEDAAEHKVTKREHTKENKPEPNKVSFVVWVSCFACSPVGIEDQDAQFTLMALCNRDITLQGSCPVCVQTWRRSNGCRLYLRTAGSCMVFVLSATLPTKT